MQQADQKHRITFLGLAQKFPNPRETKLETQEREREKALEELLKWLQLGICSIRSQMLQHVWSEDHGVKVRVRVKVRRKGREKERRGGINFHHRL